MLENKINLGSDDQIWCNMLHYACNVDEFHLSSKIIIVQTQQVVFLFPYYNLFYISIENISVQTNQQGRVRNMFQFENDNVSHY
jgi:hypothetical protein